jgi:hypothetical protein
MMALPEHATETDEPRATAAPMLSRNSSVPQSALRAVSRVLDMRALLQDVGTTVIRLPVRSPDLNGYAERWIRSLRQECLDRTIVLNEAHLRWVLAEYVSYYTQRRSHQALQHLPPEAPDAYPCEGNILARSVLGGLINDYCHLAAGRSPQCTPPSGTVPARLKLPPRADYGRCCRRATSLRPRQPTTRKCRSRSTPAEDVPG